MKVKTMNDAEVKFKGIEALNKMLGPATALKFLALPSRTHRLCRNIPATL